MTEMVKTKNETETIEGFKKTKIGWIPVDWDVVPIGKIGKIINGLTYSPNDIDENGVLVLRSSNVQNRQLEFNDNVFVHVEDGDFNPVKENDILICVRNGSRSLIGKNTLINKKSAGYAFGAFMTVYRSEFNSFLFQLFDTDIYNKAVHKNLGATINSINGKDLKKFLVPLPPKSERLKISSILSDWDEAIEKTQTIIKKLELRKKGVMQELLTGKTRLAGFNEEWEERELGYYIKSTPRPRDKPSEPFLALGLRSHGKGIFHKPNFDPNSIAMDTLYEVKENDLVVNITFAWEHAIAIADKEDEGGLVSHRFPTFTFKDNISDAMYFRYYVLQPRFKYLLGVISPGGAGRNRVMSKKDFPELVIKVPSYTEQKAISEVLQSIDHEIEQQQNYLEQLESQKKGLMQQLLTGKIRVNV